MTKKPYSDYLENNNIQESSIEKLCWQLQRKK